MSEKPDRPRSSGRPTGGPKPGGKPGSKPGGKPGAKPSGKPGSKPSGKPGGKPVGKPGSKPSGKPGGKPGAKPGSKPAGKSGGKPASPRLEDRERRPPAGRTTGGAKRGGGRTREGAERTGRSEYRGSTQRTESRIREPHVPDEITVADLDPAVQNELRTLPEGLAEIVGRHLAAADAALVEEDVDLAREHIAAARRRAGRVSVVREAAGVVAYLAGDYAEAIAELRAVRRMSGSAEYVPMMADCERGLGRPRRALELLKEVDLRTVDDATRVALVAAGARADLGQIDAALILLQSPDLARLPAGGPRARLEYARAELLAQAGRDDEAREWLLRAAESDVDGVTDAAERVEELTGLAFLEEELDPEE